MHFSHLAGLIAAPFTPMYEDGSLNIELIPMYYQFLKQNRVAGAFICGSTGEGVSLNIQEKKDIAQAWANATQHDKEFKVTLFLGGTCISECKELAIHAERVGLFAVAFTSPFYFKPEDTTILTECCKQIAGVVPDMPFYYYHIPVLNSVNFPMVELLKKVKDTIPNFAGIKYTHEDFMDYLSCLRFENQKYDMLWGRDENMLAALACGAKGSVGSTFNYAAPLYYDLIDAFNDGDLDRARELQQRSIDMILLLGKYGGIATGKAYMKIAGLDCGGFRLPVKNMSESQYNEFKKDVEALGFSDFCSKASEKQTV